MSAPLVRRSSVRRAWPEFHWEASGRTRWESWDFGRASLLVGSFAWIAASYLEVCHFGSAGTPSPSTVPGVHRSVFPLAMVLLIAFNAWVMDRALADHTAEERELPPWLRGLRVALAGIPLLGIYALPAWRRLTIERPGWSRPRHRSRPVLQLAPGVRPSGSRLTAELDSLRRRGAQSMIVLVPWVVLCQVAPAIAFMSWLAESSGPRLPFVVIGSTLHLVAGLGAAQFVRDEIRRLQLLGPRARLLQAMPLLLALPLPFSALGLLAWGPLLAENREQKTLVHTAHDRRTDLHEPALAGLRLGRLDGEEQAGLKPRSLSPELGRGEQARRAFYRLKSFLLYLDAGALGWWMSHREHLPPVVVRTPAPTPCASFLVTVGLGLLVDGAGLVSRLTGRGRIGELWTRYPCGRFLAFTQAVFASGFLAGCLLAGGDAGALGALLVAIGYVGISVSFLLAATAFALDMPGRSVPISIAWMLLLFEVPILGALLRQDASTARPVLALLGWSYALTPLWSIGLALVQGGSLLRPIGWRRIACGDLPPGTRAVPALLALATALPLGGLAIPFSIYVEQRLWPERERRASSSGGVALGDR